MNKLIEFLQVFAVRNTAAKMTDTGTGRPKYTNPQKSLADRGFTVTQYPDGTTSYSHEMDTKEDDKKGSGVAWYGNSGGQAAAAPSTVQPQSFNYDDSTYRDTMAKLNEYKGNYASPFDADLQNLYGQILNRDKFHYDINSDALYQQYRDQYVQQGQNAMRDTMGQAAALTGGYGSSYGQNVGQQAYNSYLQNLNDIVPELYDRAYQQYSDDFNRDVTAYQTAFEADNNAYNRYANERDYWTDRSDTEYNKMLTNAANMAAMGDFSGYAALYGDEAANRMYNSWAWQNEDLARKLGFIK